MSEGNGHPYSWSAIFNGYDKEIMAKCPFPVIPDYLSKKKYPEDFLSEYGEVTHIWTQESKISQQIAEASKIKIVCGRLEEMIGAVDGVLLARDDAENHYHFAKPFLQAGIPIYIDKPFALSIKDADKLWEDSKGTNKIFSCSALQFAREFSKEAVNHDQIGPIQAVWATIPKSWDKYAVHIIEPTLNLLPDRGKVKRIERLPISSQDVKGVQVEWSSGVIAQFQTTGSLPSPLMIKLLGKKGVQDLFFKDTFYAFKAALKRFIDIIHGTRPNISRNYTKEMVRILEVMNYA